MSQSSSHSLLPVNLLAHTLAGNCKGCPREGNRNSRLQLQDLDWLPDLSLRVLVAAPCGIAAWGRRSLKDFEGAKLHPTGTGAFKW